MKGVVNLSNEFLEMMVEEIMRKYHMRSYEEYANEELREKYRQQILKEEQENGSC